ncbi:MAG: transglutaminase protein [Glaciihabitans sp.]|nr:transglutaminase protein [Glaciihabitans sp.]
MSVSTRRPPSGRPTPPRAVISQPESPQQRAGAGRQDPRRSRSTGNSRISILLLVGLALCIGSLNGLLSGALWWFITVAVVALVLGAAALTRFLVRPRILPTVVAAIVGLVTLTFIFASGTAILGVVPTSETFDRFRELAGEGSASINEQGIPAEATEGIRLILAALLAAIALLVDAIAIWWKAPALAGIPLLVVLTVPGIVDPTLANPLFFGLVAVVYLLLLRPRSRRVQTSVAVGLGVVAIIGALVVPFVLPPVNQNLSGGSGGSVATGINPIVTLGDDLRRGAPTTALTYQSASSQGEYLRLTTLVEFSGREWEPVSVENMPENDVAAIGGAPGLSADVLTVPAATEVVVENAVGRWLPVPYPATSITGLTGDWFWEPDGLSIRTRDANMRGQEYTVNSLDLQPTSDQLEAAGDSSALPLAEVPRGLDPMVAEMAADVVGDAATDYDKAIALQDWFRGGDFTYSEEAPVAEGFDGSGLDVLVPFLEARTGYCVHFSSAMAVMARTLGIPSRVVVGFLPGDATNTTGSSTEFTVSSQDLHAWPELYFEGTGWVRFEPTPGRGVVPVYLPTGVDNPATPNINEATPQPSVVPSAAPTSAPSVAPATTNQAVTGSGVTANTVSWWRGLIVLAVLLLLCAPLIARSALRSSRMSAIRRGRAPATVAWREIIETARDLGLTGPAAHTPRDLSAQLAASGALVGNAVDQLANLRVAIEREVYASSSAAQGQVDVAAVADVLAALRARAGVPARLRATFVPVTLLRRILAMRFRNGAGTLGT